MAERCLSIPEQQAEFLRQEARAYIQQMQYFNDTIYKDIKDVSPKDLIKPENDDLRTRVLDWILNIRKIITFFKAQLSRTCMTDQLLHDLRGLSSPLDVSTLFLSEALPNLSNPCSIEDLEMELPKVIEIWSFYFSVVEDVLLRGLNEKQVEKDFVGTVDLDRLKDSFAFLGKKEKRQWEFDNKTALEAGDKDLDDYPFVCETDLDDIQRRLDEMNKEVVGNTGVIINFLSNASSNALKKYIQSEHVSLEVSIDESSGKLIFRIKDDGKGMEASHLDPQNKSFIFKNGVSGTKSSGLGLADFPERAASMGASISVISFRNDELHGRSPDIAFYPPDKRPDHVQEILDENPIRHISEKESKVEHATTTMFELRLKLQDKKAA